MLGTRGRKPCALRFRESGRIMPQRVNAGSIRRRAVARSADGLRASRGGSGGRARQSRTTPSGSRVMTARCAAHRRRPPRRRPRPLPNARRACGTSARGGSACRAPPRPPRSRRNPNAPCASRPLPPHRRRRSRANPRRAEIVPIVIVGRARVPGRETTFTAEDGTIWVQNDSQRSRNCPRRRSTPSSSPARWAAFPRAKGSGRAIRVRLVRWRRLLAVQVLLEPTELEQVAVIAVRIAARLLADVDVRRREPSRAGERAAACNTDRRSS